MLLFDQIIVGVYLLLILIMGLLVCTGITGAQVVGVLANLVAFAGMHQIDRTVTALEPRA